MQVYGNCTNDDYSMFDFTCTFLVGDSKGRPGVLVSGTDVTFS